MSLRRLVLLKYKNFSFHYGCDIEAETAAHFKKMLLIEEVPMQVRTEFIFLICVENVLRKCKMQF